MTDETGGKPLFCNGKKPAGVRVAFVGDPPLSYLMRVLDQSHVTIPTAALTELIAAAEECADDLASYVDTAYSKTDPDYEREVDCVRRLRAAVARVRGE